MSDQATATTTMEDQKFQDFLNERRQIPTEIREFIKMVLMYCVDMENNTRFQPHVIGTRHAPLLILSLRKIHEFYGYPTTQSTDDPGRS